MRYLSLFVLIAAGCGSAESPTTSDVAETSVTEDAAAAADTKVATTDDTGVATTEDTGTGATDTGATDTGATDTATPEAYPAGPYGTDVGKVLANLELEGYVRFDPTTGVATTATYGATSFADLRSKSPKKHALIHVSGFT